jgi:hypothetical protein
MQIRIVTVSMTYHWNKRHFQPFWSVTALMRRIAWKDRLLASYASPSIPTYQVRFGPTIFCVYAVEVELAVQQAVNM